VTRALFIGAWTIILGSLALTLALALEIEETLRAVGRLLFCW
jgi:hypothetical protein